MTPTKVFMALNAATIVLLAFFLIAGPIVVDTMFSADMLFLAHLGWRGLNGASPIVDFPHFYGGMTAWFMTQAFRLFGVGYKSVDYGFVIMFAATAPVVAGLCWRRIAGPGIILLLALSACLMLSLHLIESATPWAEVSHAYIYNHTAIALILGLTVFTLQEADEARIETGGALLAGVAIYALILLKTTFGVMGISVLLGCLVMGRWRAAGLVGLGALLGMLAMDPGMDRALGSLRLFFVSGSTLQENLPLWLLVISGQMIFAQISIVMLVVALGWAVWHSQTPGQTPGQTPSQTPSQTPGAQRVVIAALLCCGGYLGAMLNTNGAPDHKLFPMAVALLLISIERLPKGGVLGGLVAALPYCVAYMLILPGLFSAAFAYGKAQEFAGRTLEDQGPMAQYQVIGRATTQTGARAPDLATRRAAVENYTNNMLIEKPFLVDDSDKHVLRMLGLDLLQTIPNIRQYGIISNEHSFDFTATLFSKPVLSFDVWINPGLPFSADQPRLGADVDMVMITPDKPRFETVTEALRPKMGNDFTACKQTLHWTLYVRRGHLEDLCTE